MRKEKVTREKAEHWLAKTRFNRSISKVTIEHYARAMQEGKWNSDVAPAILIDQDTDGVLNGQHRLKAFLSTDLDHFETYVHHTDRSSISVIDTGKPRHLSDTLEIRGHVHAKEKSAWLNRGVQWVTGDTVSNLLDRTEQVEVIESSANVEKATEVARHLSSRTNKVVRVPIGTSAVLWDISEYGYGGDVLVDFIERLQASRDLTRPMARLQSRMQEALNRGAKFGLPTDVLSYLIARVYIATINDEELTKMYARRNAVTDLPGWKEWREATYGRRFG
jgi:hypothetical protein